MKNNESLPVVVEPKEIMTTERARSIARELMNIVKELKWAKNFGGEKDHLEIDAWQFIAAKDGVTASIVATQELKDKEGNFIGFFAKAALLRNDEMLSQADHECTIEEKNWRDKPRYSLLGMAQTRAMSRVCRNRYSWIARMGGFSGTPADEMDAEFNKNRKRKHEPKPEEQESKPKTSWDLFWKSMTNKGYGEDDRKSMNEFIAQRCKDLRKTKTDIMLMAIENVNNFIEEWKQWKD